MAETFQIFDPNSWTIFNNVATHKMGSTTIAFGSSEINEGIHQWSVKYEQTNRCCGGIGITTDTNNKSGYSFSYQHSVNLHYTKTDRQQKYNMGSSQSTTIDNKLLNSGDIIRIALDCDKKTVTFYQNEGLVFVQNNLTVGPNLKYRLCVYCDKGDKFTILKSSGTVSNISLKELSLNLAVINQSLKQVEDALNTSTLEQLTKIKRKTNTFLDECKQFEQDYENTKKCVQELNAKADKAMHPNTNNYKKWDIEAICRYVFSLENQRFAKYAQSLKEALQKQQISGEDLREIEANDLYTMGIDNFKDRKALAKYFKSLGDEEGALTQND